MELAEEEFAMAMPKQSANPYLKTQVETASKEQLVVMLFDGIIRFSETARKHMEKKEIEETHHNLMRAQAIVMELIYTVDKEKGGEIAENLLALHAYAYSCLVNANMHKDTTKIDEVQHIYRELREGWIGAMQSLGLSTTAPAAPTGPAAAAPATGKTLGSAAPKAPAMPPKPAAPTAGYGPGKTMLPPNAPQGSSLQAPSLGKALIPGIPAAAAPTAAAPAAPAIPPAPVKPSLSIPSQPQAGGLYGMGKTAMPAASQTPSVPAMPKAPVNAYAANMANMNIAKPATPPTAAVPPAANVAPAAAAPVTPNQQQKSAMLSAYNKGRSIA